MTCRVYTSRVTYPGEDGLRVTRYHGHRDGLPFAPSEAILLPALVARKAGRLDAHWPTYAAAYVAEMRASYKANPRAWAALLAREEVTLLCFCDSPRLCHRYLLADLLTKCGATYCGER